MNPEMAYGFALQPYMMDMNQLKNFTNEILPDQLQQTNENTIQAPTNKNKLKKKKKLNNGEAAETDGGPASPKLKKSKSDGNFSLVKVML